MTDFSSTARLRELGATLRRCREACGITGTEMAARLHWHVSTVSRTETGKRSISAIEVATYLGLCGITDERLDELVALTSEPDDYRIKPHLGKMPDGLRSLIFHESTASTIENFEPIFMPGYLQTEDYTRALLEESGNADPANIPTWVEIRKARRAVLTKYNPAQCTFLIHENAFRMPVGGPKVMEEQLLHLLFVDDRPQCVIRVIPVSAGSRGAMPGSLVIFGYPDASPLVYISHQTTSEFLESRQEVAAHRDLLKRLTSVALTEAESREWIVRAASEYDQQGARQYDHGSPSLAEE